MASSDCIFLTGATGFVGSHIVRELLGAGYEVRALRRSSDAAHSPDVEWIEGDLRNVGAFARARSTGAALLASTAPRSIRSPRATEPKFTQ